MNAVLCLVVVSLAVAGAQVRQVPPTGAFLPPGAIAARFSFQPQLQVPFISAQRGAPLFVGPQGSGLEGQYIPDNLENLYDDGSYKPWLYGL